MSFYAFSSREWLILPAALLILILQFFATYGTIFRAFKWLTLVLFAYVITAFFAHPGLLSVFRATFIPTLQFSPAFVMALVAVLGTTISPYLFFWQASSEIASEQAAGRTSESQRKGIRLSELRAARLDIFVGMLFSNVVMYFIILTSGAILHSHGQTNIQTADQAAAALKPLAGQFAFILFAFGRIGTGLLAIPILTGSAAYAMKEFLNIPGGLASKPRYRPTFYLIILVATLVGVGLNFLHLDPIKALFLTAVINGIVAPPLLLLIVLLGSDASVMKQRVSGRLSKSLTWAATLIMSGAALALLFTQFVPH